MCGWSWHARKLTSLGKIEHGSRLPFPLVPLLARVGGLFAKTIVHSVASTSFICVVQRRDLLSCPAVQHEELHAVHDDSTILVAALIEPAPAGNFTEPNLNRLVS